MPASAPPSTTELQDAYARAQLRRIGLTFAQAMAWPALRWALEKSALAQREKFGQTHHLPTQPRLI